MPQVKEPIFNITLHVIPILALHERTTATNGMILKNVKEKHF